MHGSTGGLEDVIDNIHDLPPPHLLFLMVNAFPVLSTLAPGSLGHAVVNHDDAACLARPALDLDVLHT